MGITAVTFLGLTPAHTIRTEKAIRKNGVPAHESQRITEDAVKTDWNTANPTSLRVIEDERNTSGTFRGEGTILVLTLPFVL